MKSGLLILADSNQQALEWLIQLNRRQVRPQGDYRQVKMVEKSWIHLCFWCNLPSTIPSFLHLTPLWSWPLHLGQFPGFQPQAPMNTKLCLPYGIAMVLTSFLSQPLAQLSTLTLGVLWASILDLPEVLTCISNTCRFSLLAQPPAFPNSVRVRRKIVGHEREMYSYEKSNSRKDIYSLKPLRDSSICVLWLLPD